MTIGERIKIIREFRKMTQKQLGLAIGYDDKSARTRISQYEIGFRIPKHDTLLLIADVLNINVQTISEYKLETSLDIIEYLFWFDEMMKRKGIILFQTETLKTSFSFSASNADNFLGIKTDFEDLEQHMSEWYLKKNQLEKGVISEEKYFEWLVTYPNIK